MKKIALFIATLFVVVGAMAQTTYPIVYMFGEHADFATWESAYSQHVLDYPEAVVTFEKANKQPSGNAIVDIPVTKGNYVQVALKDASQSITAIKLVARQWNTKAQTITLNAGSAEGNLSATGNTSSNFFLEETTLPENTKVVRFTFSSTNNQIGIESISFVIGGVTEVAVEAPQFSAASGVYEEAFDLELTCATEGAEIYYTLNGGETTKYESAINLATKTTVKAWAVKGEDKSREVSATYTFVEYIENATVKQILDAEVSDYVWYELTGTITNLNQEKLDYGNFDLVDATGSIYVYGLTSTKQSYNDKSFPSLNLKDGDVITIWGTRSVYKDEAQVGGPAYFVEKHSGETVAVEDVVVNNIYVMNGMVVSNEAISIFTITGQNVTDMNGRLENGIYIVKTANSAVKVVVK